MTREHEQVIRDAAEGGKLACADAFRICAELGIPLRELGEFCDEEGIKIVHCQLGTFP